jgi:hypothetical protein
MLMTRLSRALALALAPLMGLSLAGTPADAVIFNGVECDSVTITGTTETGGIAGSDLVIEIDRCGPNDLAPIVPSLSEKCGNGILDDGEECDGDNLDGLNCETLGYTGGILACNQICRLDISACDADEGPTPTPAPTQTPTPSPTPPPQQGVCPNNGTFLTTPLRNLANGYGTEFTLNVGETKTFCARAEAPTIPADVDIRKLTFLWNDSADYECNEAEVSVTQSFAPYISRGPSTGASGALRFAAQSGFGSWGTTCPECVKRGIYVITITGKKIWTPSDPKCYRQNLAWAWD